MKQHFLLLLLFFSTCCQAQGNEQYWLLLQQSKVIPQCTGEGIDAAAVVSAYKTRVQAAGGTMTTAQETAWITFVQKLSDSCLYNGRVEIWLPVYTTSAASALGFKNAYNLTFPNGASFSTSGVDFTISQYANTGLIPRVAFLDNTSTELCVYSGENATATDATDIGSYNGAGQAFAVYTLANGGTGGRNLGGAMSVPWSDGRGLAMLSHYPSPTDDNVSETYLYRNSVEQVTGVTRSDGDLPTLPVYLGAINLLGSVYGNTTRQVRYAEVGLGMSRSKAVYYSNCVNQLLTAYSLNTY